MCRKLKNNIRQPGCAHPAAIHTRLQRKWDATSNGTAARSHSALTLVELLVVVAVISLLLALVLPALRSARESGKSVSCKSNLRQLAVGGLIYASDNSDLVPYYADRTDLPPYVTGRHFYQVQYALGKPRAPDPWRGRLGIWNCPADLPLGGYVAAGLLPPAAELNDNSYAYNLDASCQYGSRRPDFIRLNQIVNPSAKLMFIDSMYRRVNFWYMEPEFNRLPPGYRHPDQSLNAALWDGHADSYPSFRLMLPPQVTAATRLFLP